MGGKGGICIKSLGLQVARKCAHMQEMFIYQICVPPVSVALQMFNHSLNQPVEALFTMINYTLILHSRTLAWVKPRVRKMFTPEVSLSTGANAVAETRGGGNKKTSLPLKNKPVTTGTAAFIDYR